MPNKSPPWFLLGIAAIAGYMVWQRLRNPLGIAPPVTKEVVPATVQGTNATTDPSVPESRTPAAEASGILDQDPTAPVWVPVAGHADNGYWALAGDLASGLLQFELTGDRSQLEPPPALPRARDFTAGTDSPASDQFVTADDASISPAMAWEEEAARQVALGTIGVAP